MRIRAHGFIFSCAYMCLGADGSEFDSGDALFFVTSLALNAHLILRIFAAKPILTKVLCQ